MSVSSTVDTVVSGGAVGANPYKAYMPCNSRGDFGEEHDSKQVTDFTAAAAAIVISTAVAAATIVNSTAGAAATVIISTAGATLLCHYCC